MRPSESSSKKSASSRAAARRPGRARLAMLETLESRLLLTGAFSTADMAGTWTFSAMNEEGTIVLDASNNITGGSLLHDDGSTTTPAGTYTIAADGTLTLTIGVDTLTGAMNVSRETIALSTPATTDTLGVLVKRTASIFSNSDLNGSWSMFINGDDSSDTGLGHIGFDGTGNIAATGTIQTSAGTTDITGGTYTVASNGGVTMTLDLTEPGIGAVVTSFTGAINNSRNVLALNPTDLQAAALAGQPRLATMVANGGIYSNADFNGAWTITVDGVEGSVTFNGAGKITAGSVIDTNGSTDTITGTYAVSPIGTFTMNLNLVQGATHFSLATAGTLNSTRSIAAMEQTPSAASGTANSKRSLMMLVRSGSTPPILTHIATLSTADAGQPFNITYSTLSGSSNATDYNGATVNFDIASLGGGTLTLSNVQVTVGQVISAGETLVWTPPVGKSGNLTAFSVKADDGSATSVSAVPVIVTTVLPATVHVVATKSSASEINNGTTVGVGQFTLSRANGDLTSALDVNVTLTGTATNGTDYTAIPTTLEFAAGQKTLTVNVVPADEHTAGPNKTVLLTIQPDAAYAIVAAQSHAQVTIINTAPTVSITASRSSAREATGQTTGFGQFTVTRTSANRAEAQVVNYTVTGTAVAGTNYTALSGTVTIPAGKTSATINVNPIDDFLADPTLTVIATLAADPSYNITPVVSRTAAIVKILDDAPTITISASRSSGTETNGQTTGFGQFRVTRSSTNLYIAQTVNYTIAGTAVPGTNYTALTGTVIIPVGKTSATITVNPIDDNTVDPTLTVIATVSADPSYRLSPTVSKDTATVKILDNSSTLSIAATHSSALEASGQAGQFTISRSGGDLTKVLTVDYTVAGTAVADTNYTALSGTLTIPAGKTSATIAVSPLDDQTVDPTLTVIATLVPDANPSYKINPTRTFATVNIIDDSPTISIAATKPTALEATGQTTGFGLFTLTRTGGPLTNPLTVDYTISGTAVADTDYTALSGTVTFAAGASTTTIEVNPIDNSNVGPSLTVVATIVPDANPSYKINPLKGIATINITENG